MTLYVPATLSVLVSVWMESVFYGMNVIIYFTCLYIFVSRKARGSYKIQNGLVVLSTLLFSSATAHMAINVRRLIEGYVLPPTKAAMNNYLSDITQPTDIAKQFLVVTTYFFSDFMIVRSSYPLLSPVGKIIYSLHRHGVFISCGLTTGVSRSYH